jgi:hypothetical protein
MRATRLEPQNNQLVGDHTARQNQPRGYSPFVRIAESTYVNQGALRHFADAACFAAFAVALVSVLSRY